MPRALNKIVRSHYPTVPNDPFLQLCWDLTPQSAMFYNPNWVRLRFRIIIFLHRLGYVVNLNLQINHRRRCTLYQLGKGILHNLAVYQYAKSGSKRVFTLSDYNLLRVEMT